MAQKLFDIDKRYKYKIAEVDAAHQLVFERAELLHWAVHRFNETVKQARWVERHRPEVKKLEMTDGSVFRGEEAENAWEAFNNNDWTCISGAVMVAEELEKELEEAGCDDFTESVDLH